MDNEEAYFEGDDEEESSCGNYRPSGPRLMESQENSSNLFSFVETSFGQGGTSTFAGDSQSVQGKIKEKCPAS